MLNKNYKLIVFLNIIIFLNLIFFSQNFLHSVEPEEIMLNKEQEVRARNISKNIRCMVCQNQSIDDSNAPLAKDLRLLIRDKIKSGHENKEIYDFLVERYGDFILLKPPLKSSTFALWFMPLVFLLIGIIVILRHNKKYINKKNN